MYTTKTLSNYIYSYLGDVDPTSDLFDMETIEDLVEELVLDSVEDVLTPEETREMYKTKSNTGSFDDYLEEKFGDKYQDLLLDVKNKILSDYILGSE